MFVKLGGTPSHFLMYLLTVLSMASTAVQEIAYSINGQESLGSTAGWYSPALNFPGSQLFFNFVGFPVVGFLSAGCFRCPWDWRRTTFFIGI